MKDGRGVVMIRVVNDQGRAFNVRAIFHGERYGLDDKLVHRDSDPLVEFWDAKYEHDPRFTRGLGQFAARYFLSTLRERHKDRGLALLGHVPEWTVTASNVEDAIAEIDRALGKGTEP